MAKLVNSLVVLSLLFGLINCQSYGSQPTLRKSGMKTILRDQQKFDFVPTTTTTTTTTPTPIYDYGTDETFEEVPVDTFSSNFNSYSNDNTYAQPTMDLRKMQPVVQLKPILKELPVAYKKVQQPIMRDTTTTTTTVPTPTYFQQPTISRDKLMREKLLTPSTSYTQTTFTKPSLSRPIQKPSRDQILQTQTTMQTTVLTPTYGSTNTLLTPLLPSTCAENPCLNDAVCIPSTTGGFFCQCPWGWTGERCEICITDCASNPCPLNKKCKALYKGGYECVCPPDRMGINCEISRDICSTNPCLNGGICKSIGENDFTCTCTTPFAGKTCEAEWTNPCTAEVLRSITMTPFAYPWDTTKYIVCTDIDTWSAMPCATGTFFHTTAGHCVPEGYEAPNCPTGYCKNDAECVVDETTTELTCVCKPGFTGTFCEVDIDECTTYGSLCGTGQCVDQVNTYFCFCQDGTIGLDCRTTVENPCTLESSESDLSYFPFPSTNGDHYIHCSGDSFTVRKCADGLFWNQEEKTCTIDQPTILKGSCKLGPCKNGGVCTDFGVSGFTCTCKTGYTGDLCENMIDFCTSNPCMNGGKCLSYAGGYTCVCPGKVVDDCCCNGIINPCPTKEKLIPGVNNYFPHLFPSKYIHCDFDGRAFVRNCASGAKWRQESLTCMSDELILNTTTTTIIENDEILTFPSSGNTYSQLPLVQTPTYQTERPTLKVKPVGKPAPAKVVVHKPISRVIEQTKTSYEQMPTKTISRVVEVPQTTYQKLPTPTQVVPKPITRVIEVPKTPTTTYTTQDTYTQETFGDDDNTFFTDDLTSEDTPTVETTYTQTLPKPLTPTGRVIQTPQVRPVQRTMMVPTPMEPTMALEETVTVPKPTQRVMQTQTVQTGRTLATGTMQKPSARILTPQQPYRKY